MLAVLALAVSPAQADVVASRCFTHGAADRVQVEQWQACRGFTVKTADGEVFTSSVDDGSGSYIVSADGHVVVFVADYATMTGHRDGFSDDWRTGEPGVGVRIYRDGVAVGSWTVESLVAPKETVSSVSHLDWVDDASFSAPITEKWALTTRSGRTIAFATTSPSR